MYRRAARHSGNFDWNSPVLCGNLLVGMTIASELSGKTSTCRAVTLAWNVAAIAAWLFVCIWTKSLVAIPESVVVLTLGVNALKVGQRYIENKES